MNHFYFFKLQFKASKQVSYPKRLQMKFKATAKSIEALKGPMTASMPEKYTEIQEWFANRLQFVPGS